MLMGLMVLVGYCFDLKRLIDLCPLGPITNPYTATAFIAVGLAIFLARPFRTGNLSLALGLLVIAIAIFRLTNAGLSWSLLPAHWRVEESSSVNYRYSLNLELQMLLPRLGLKEDTHHDRFIYALSGSFPLLVLGMSIVLMRFRRFDSAQFAAAAAAVPSYLALLGFLYGIVGYSGLVSFPAILGTFACCAAILFRTAHRGPMRAFLSRKE